VRKQYESDYLVEISVKTVLSMIDMNDNGKLDFDGTEEVAFKVLVQDIPSLDPDSMTLDSLKKISNNPQQINGKIDSLLISLGRADSSYDNFVLELDEAAEKTDKLDTTMASSLGDIIRKFSEVLPFYYYKDRVDNDDDYYDTDGDGVMEPMIWIDWDGDDRIDINPLTGPDEYIGDSVHMRNNPTLYEVIDEAGADYRRYRYKGGYTYEFIGGDWGVDEEIMDGKDNDRDNLTDEDTRTVADTLDDEGNSADTIPLIWTDSDNDLFIDDLEIQAGTSSYIDEEWYDGVDNDGDGEVDEDVGERIPPESARAAIIARIRP
jgi:hypothetical protein